MKARFVFGRKSTGSGPGSGSTWQCSDSGKFQGSWGQPFPEEFSDGNNKSSPTAGRGDQSIWALV